MIIQAQGQCISLCSSAFNSNHHHYQHFRVGVKAHASLPFLSRFPSVATMSTRSSSSHWRRRKRSDDVVSPSSSSSSRSSWRCAAASASPPPPPAPPTADKVRCFFVYLSRLALFALILLLPHFQVVDFTPERGA